MTDPQDDAATPDPAGADPAAPVAASFVEHCHRWLQQHAGQCQALLDELYADQEQMGITFADGPIPTFLRPCFLTPRQDRRLQRSAELLLSCAERVIRAMPEHPEIQRLIGLDPDSQRLASLPSGLPRQVLVARPDALMVGDRVRFIELNADSPAGVAWTDQREEVFQQLPFIADAPFASQLRGSCCRSFLAEAVREALWYFNGSETPAVAIVDWRDVKTRHEFAAVKRYFARAGLPTVIADPRELELRGDTLYAAGTAVNVVYRRVIIKELLAHRDEPGVRDLLAAYEGHHVCVVNPFAAKVPGQKSFFAVLSDERYDPLFSDAQNRMKRQCVPFTRVLEPGFTTYAGKRADLFELARAARPELVLKPVSGYGGKDVAIGRDTAPGAWGELLEQAARVPGTWIVQAYAEIPEEPLPVLEPELRFVTHKINLNPYLFGGRYAGSLGRAARGSVINVSQGGGIVPMFRLQA